MRENKIIRVCAPVLAAMAMLLMCAGSRANPIEINTDWTTEMADGYSAIVFEFTSFGEEENSTVDVEWFDGNTWISLEGTWTKNGTVTVSGSGDSWEMDRVARKIPCPEQGDWQYRIVMDNGPEYPLDIPVSETVTCAAAGENADEFYSLAGESLQSCSFAPVISDSSFFSLLFTLLF